MFVLLNLFSTYYANKARITFVRSVGAYRGKKTIILFVIDWGVLAYEVHYTSKPKTSQECSARSIYFSTSHAKKARITVFRPVGTYPG